MEYDTLWKAYIRNNRACFIVTKVHNEHSLVLAVNVILDYCTQFLIFKLYFFLKWLAWRQRRYFFVSFLSTLCNFVSNLNIMRASVWDVTAFQVVYAACLSFCTHNNICPNQSILMTVSDDRYCYGYSCSGHFWLI